MVSMTSGSYGTGMANPGGQSGGGSGSNLLSGYGQPAGGSPLGGMLGTPPPQGQSQSWGWPFPAQSPEVAGTTPTPSNWNGDSTFGISPFAGGGATPWAGSGLAQISAQQQATPFGGTSMAGIAHQQSPEWSNSRFNRMNTQPPAPTPPPATPPVTPPAPVPPGPPGYIPPGQGYNPQTAMASALMRPQAGTGL